MARREIFAGNWKMHTLRDEAVRLVEGVKNGAQKTMGRDIVVFPPAVHLREIARICAGSMIDVGAQNMYHRKEGAFTGEISPPMVKDAGARYILIGHSERRHVFGETDDDVNKKVVAALEYGLDPMVCVGELLEEREAGKSEDVVRRQVEAAFNGISAAGMSTVVIAYEPVWAIGTGRVATPDMAEAMHVVIRDALARLYGEPIAGAMPVLYGGSVKPDNIAGLHSMTNIDGVLVGGASLTIQSFLDIINVAV